MSARNGLGLLPFSDYADPDPNALPLDEPDPFCICGGTGADHDDDCPRREPS